jgi:RHS repeat-associated protein
VYEQGSFEPVARVVQLASHIEQKRLTDIAYETRRFVRIGESEETINQRIQDKSQPLINIYHYHCNHLGTPQELSDEKGDVIWLSYDRAWGGSFDTIYKQQFINNFAISESELQPIKFQGQSLDTETGLHYNRFRYYDSDVGMFISRDPIGLLGGSNVFQYAPNPVMWIDPWGLACLEAKPNTGAWKSSPNWDKWKEKGGTITPHPDGSVTFTRKDGVSVKYNKDGYPDFSPFAVHNVPVPGLQGNHGSDFKLANEAAGIGTTQKIPAPYTDTHTWHHHENGINMLLVPKTIHNAPLGGFPHAGGVSNSKR